MKESGQNLMKKLSWLSLLSIICLFIPITANAINITEVVPSTGPIGFPVIIKGEFNDNPEQKVAEFAKIRVRFGEQEATEVELLSDTEIRVITPVSRTGPVDVTVEYSDGKGEARSFASPLPNGFTFDGFFVFDPERSFGFCGDSGQEGIFDPDSGQHLPICIDIPVNSLPPNDKYPSIYIKPVPRNSPFLQGFDINRIIGDKIYEIRVRNEAGGMVTRFDNSIIISFFIDANQSPMPDVLLYADLMESRGEARSFASPLLRPIPTVVSAAQSPTALSPPELIGRITQLSAGRNYLTAGVNHAPTINSPDGKVNVMSVVDTVSVTGKSAEITLTGFDPDSDRLTFIITELPTNGYLHDGGTQIYLTPSAITSDSVTYTPRIGYFGTDQLKFKVSDSAMESETQVVNLNVSLPPPKVTDITPKIGPAWGGTAVMVSGENFVSGAKVYFGNQEATMVMFFSSNLLAAFTPPVSTPEFSANSATGSAAVSVTVTLPDGSSATLGSGDSSKIAAFAGESVTTYGFILPPVVMEINPKSGPMAGGTEVTITGENFVNGQTKVYIGGTQVTTFTVNSSESISAITPLSPPGTKNVTVVTPGGTSKVGVTFTYTPSPIISRVSPSRIPLSGGIELDITGGNFTAAGEDAPLKQVTVTIGGTSAIVTLITDTLITVEAPPGDVGTTDVVVTTSDGLSPQRATLPSGVTYISSPIVSSITPLSGPTSGGTLLTLRGFNFVAGTTVTIVATEGRQYPAIDVTFVSTTEISARTPLSPLSEGGFFDVLVTNPSGEFTQILSGFHYIAPPTITSVEPAEASIEGGTPLTITGVSFDEEAIVTIAGKTVIDSKVLSATQITAITPTAPSLIIPPFPPELLGDGKDWSEDTTVDLVITNPDGQSASIDFTYKVLPPKISSVSPSLISVAGGTTIVIGGSSFIEGLTVTIDGNVISDVDFVSNNKIKIQAHAGETGSVDLRVTNPDGQTSLSAGAITYVDKPFIDKITPNFGPISGGTLITITGSNFDADATVKIVKRGEAYASGTVAQVSNLAETEISAITPANAEGFHNIIVENPTTGFKDTLIGGFKYIAPPKIDSVTPNSCSILGGQSINLTGSYFKEGLKVTLDGQVATTTLVSETAITATVPSWEQAGVIDLVVTNPDGLSDKIDFTYTVPTPTISGVSPSIISTAGGTNIVIRGAGFIEGLTVTIGGNVIDNVTFISNNEIRVQVPASPPGAVDLQITNPPFPPLSQKASPFPKGGQGGFGGILPFVNEVGGGQTGSLKGAITYVDKPFIDKITPNSGPISGGTLITIIGSNFDSDATVKIGGKLATNMTVVSSTEITATTPANPPLTPPLQNGGKGGFCDVVAENPTDGFKATLTSGFKYLAPPQVDSVTPNSCSILGGQSVLIAGSYFQDGATVMIGEKAASDIEIVSSTEIKVKAPPASAGKYDLKVKNPDGLQSTLVGGFEYIIPAPMINSIVPKDGPSAGGISITISGMNFFDGATVTIGGNEPSQVEVTSSDRITAILPPAPDFSQGEGAAEIVVTNPDEQSATLSGGFTYFVKVPGITSITPESGPTTGRIAIAIKGEHFLSGVTVTIGGFSALDVNVVSASEVNATIPTGTAGTADVVLTHPNWASPVTLSDEFTYIAQPPQVDSVEPPRGKVAGGTAISIIGNYFIDGATVTIGGNPATDVAFVSSIKITAKTPQIPPTHPLPRGGTVDVVITNPDSQSGTLSDGFTYIPLPTVTAVSPDFGPTPGGTKVTITGSDFVEGANVTIGGNDATDVVVLSTKIFAKTPAGSAGLANVVVNNPASQSGTLTGGFTYIPHPAVTAISPQRGPVIGGTEITITGENFVDGATVRIGGISATDAQILSGTKIRAITPPFNRQSSIVNRQSVDVLVTNPASLSDTLTGGFTYVPPPVVTAISPQRGPVVGGTEITITGENFQDGANVKIGENPATDVAFVSATTITAQTPQGSAGNADVVLTNPDTQSDTLTGCFTYVPPPIVTVISPQSGPVVGGTEITITGENFQDGASVKLGGVVATDVAFVSETTITAKTPQGVATEGRRYDLVVTNPDNQSDTLPAAFEYIPPPIVTAISPQSGPVVGGTEITITGENFLSGATVTLGEILSTDVQILSGTKIRAITPPFNLQSSIFNLQSVDMVVTNPDSQSGTLADGFTYIPPPVIKSISPSRCSLSGGIEVTINGDNFQDGATVKIGENAATDVMFVSETKISAKIPARASGIVDVVVTNPDTQSDTLTNAFTYVPPPDVMGISPSSGSTLGGTEVSITGANFAYGVTVKIGDKNATDVAVLSSSLITAKTPAGSAGTVDIVVSHPVSQSDTLPSAFTYIPPPIVTEITPSEGAMSGGTEITIIGQNFQSGATVTVEGKLAIDVAVISSTQISAKTPEGDVGNAMVMVTNPDGQSWSHEFTYIGITYKNIEANRKYHFYYVDLTIDIPVGAFTTNERLEFELPTQIPPFLGGLYNLNQIYTLRLTGETNPTFGKPLTLTFNYQDEQLPENISEESLRVYYLEDGLWKYIDGVVDTQNNTVTVEIDHFSTYSLLAGYAYGDVSGNGDIKPYDAALVLEKAVGFIGDLPPIGVPAFRFYTGDVTGNGTISAFDSVSILRKAAGLPPDVDFPNQYAFLVETQKQITTAHVSHIAEPVTISIPVDVTATPGAKGIAVPIRITDVTGGNVISADLTVSYDTKVLTAIRVTLDGTIAVGGDVVSNVDDVNGKINIGVIKVNPPFIGSGVLAFILFDVEDNLPPATVSTLSLLRASLNEGRVPSEKIDGKISVSAPKELPIVTAINPNRGPESGGTPVTITGENFVNGVTVAIGGELATHVTVVSETEITAQTPAGTEGTAEVVVSNGEQSSALEDGFTYVSDSRLVHRIISAGEAYELNLFNLTLIIPAGAITTDKTLEVEVPEATAPLLGGLHEMDGAYDLRFIGETPPFTKGGIGGDFSQPLTLIFHYQEDALPPRVEEESLQVYSQNDDLWRFFGGVVDTQQDTLTVEIDRFSTYILLAGYAYGDISGDGQISAFDAALVLQGAVGIIGKMPSEEYPAYRFQTGDVSGNGRISAFDAAMILRKSVGLPPDLFHPRTEFPVEVQDASPRKAILENSLIPKALVTVKRVGEEIHLQLSIDNVQSTIAIDFHCSFDPKVLQFVSADSSATGERQLTQINAVTGDVKVGIASVDKLEEKEPLLVVKIRDKTIDLEPSKHAFPAIQVQLNGEEIPVEISAMEKKPVASLLLQNYPNPFNPETWIPYVLNAESPVRIQIYNSMGQLIRTLNLGVQSSGHYISRKKAAYWDGRTDLGERVASGVYFYVLKVGGREGQALSPSKPTQSRDFTATRKMVICQ